MSSQLPPPGITPNPRLRPVEEWDAVPRRDANGYALDTYDDFGDGEYDEYGEYDELTVGDRIRSFGGRLLIRLGWTALAAGLAFGGAGVLAAMSHPPTAANRPELTYEADQQLSVKLDTAVRDLALLNDDVQSLGDQTRKALSSLAQVNQVGLDDSWNAGANDVNSIDVRAATLDKRLACASWNADRVAQLLESYSPAMIDRYDHVCRALSSVSPLRGDWESLVAGTKTAMQVATDMNDHDQAAASALQMATQGRFPEALAKLKDASAAVADANSIATTMAKIADVSTLQDWLERTKAMDSALGVLWQAMIDSKGEVTIQVTAALKNVNSAKEMLPDSTSVMSIALHEMAGGLTSDGIAIETAKGHLASALADLVGTTAGVQ
jgi:hypothetical protein